MGIAQSMDHLTWTIQGIYISGNPVAYVHPAAFQGLRQLRELMIHSPELREAPSLQFIGHSLTELDLSHSKVEFENGYFKQGYKIQYLYLQNCDLRRIPPSVRAMAKSLVRLFLDVNMITTLKPLEGILFAKLSHLDLNRNRIPALDPDVLLLPRLFSMDLSENLLNQIADPSQALWGTDGTNGAYVHLGYNPWHCGASMFWLLQALHHERFDFTFQRYRSNVTLILINTWYCTTPKKYDGTMVVDAMSTILTLRSRDNLKSRGMKINLVWRCSHRLSPKAVQTDKGRIVITD